MLKHCPAPANLPGWYGSPPQDSSENAETIVALVPGFPDAVGLHPKIHQRMLKLNHQAGSAVRFLGSPPQDSSENAETDDYDNQPAERLEGSPPQDSSENAETPGGKFAPVAWVGGLHPKIHQRMLKQLISVPETAVVPGSPPQDSSENAETLNQFDATVEYSGVSTPRFIREC